MRKGQRKGHRRCEFRGAEVLQMIMPTHLRNCEKSPMYVKPAPPPPSIAFRFSVRASVDELSQLSRPQLEAFMHGMAMVVAAIGE